MRDFFKRFTSRKLWVTLLGLGLLFFSHLPAGKLTLASVITAVYVTMQGYVDGQK